MVQHIAEDAERKEEECADEAKHIIPARETSFLEVGLEAVDEFFHCLGAAVVRCRRILISCFVWVGRVAPPLVGCLEIDFLYIYSLLADYLIN